MGVVMRKRVFSGGIFEDPELARCGTEGMLLYLGLASMADREGRLACDPGLIKSRVFPFQDVDIIALLRKLAEAGKIAVYMGGGEEPCIWLPAFKLEQHKTIYRYERESELPPCPGSAVSAKVRRALEREGGEEILDGLGSGEGVATDFWKHPEIAAYARREASSRDRRGQGMEISGANSAPGQRRFSAENGIKHGNFDDSPGSALCKRLESARETDASHEDSAGAAPGKRRNSAETENTPVFSIVSRDAALRQHPDSAIDGNFKRGTSAEPAPLERPYSAETGKCVNESADFVSHEAPETSDCVSDSAPKPASHADPALPCPPCAISALNKRCVSAGQAPEPHQASAGPVNGPVGEADCATEKAPKTDIFNSLNSLIERSLFNANSGINSTSGISEKGDVDQDTGIVHIEGIDHLDVRNGHQESEIISPDGGDTPNIESQSVPGEPDQTGESGSVSAPQTIPHSLNSKSDRKIESGSEFDSEFVSERFDTAARASVRSAAERSAERRGPRSPAGAGQGARKTASLAARTEGRPQYGTCYERMEALYGQTDAAATPRFGLDCPGKIETETNSDEKDSAYQEEAYGQVAGYGIEAEHWNGLEDYDAFFPDFTPEESDILEAVCKEDCVWMDWEFSPSGDGTFVFAGALFNERTTYGSDDRDRGVAPGDACVTGKGTSGIEAGSGPATEVREQVSMRSYGSPMDGADFGDRRTDAAAICEMRAPCVSLAISAEGAESIARALSCEIERITERKLDAALAEKFRPAAGSVPQGIVIDGAVVETMGQLVAAFFSQIKQEMCSASVSFAEEFGAGLKAEIAGIGNALGMMIKGASEQAGSEGAKAESADQTQKKRRKSRSKDPEYLSVNDMKDDESDAPGPVGPCPQKRIVDLYHKILPELPRIKGWHTGRQRELRARWKDQWLAGKYGSVEEGLVYWERFFGAVRESDFLMGKARMRDGNTFTTSIDFLLRRDKFQMLIEGRYANRD